MNFKEYIETEGVSNSTVLVGACRALGIDMIEGISVKDNLSEYHELVFIFGRGGFTFNSKKAIELHRLGARLKRFEEKAELVIFKFFCGGGL